MRTTAKPFKEAVREHIMYILPGERAAWLELEDVSKGFTSYYEDNKMYHPNYQDCFVEWCRCLPGELNVEFENYKIEQTLEGWFKTIGKEFEPERLDDVMDYYCRLIHRELPFLMKQYKIESEVL